MFRSLLEGKVLSCVTKKRTQWLQVELRFGCRDWPFALERVTEAARCLGNPPLYFARYGTDHGKVVVNLQTSVGERAVGRAFPPRFKPKVTYIGSASLEHAKAYELALMLRDKPPQFIQDVVHWLFNMLSFNYLQEVRCHVELAAAFLQPIGRPNEPKLPERLQPTAKPDEQKHPKRR